MKLICYLINGKDTDTLTIKMIFVCWVANEKSIRIMDHVLDLHEEIEACSLSITSAFNFCTFSVSEGYREGWDLIFHEPEGGVTAPKIKSRVLLATDQNYRNFYFILFKSNFSF